MASASAGSQSSVGGSGSATATNNNGAGDAEAENGVVNAKYPLWAHATKVSSDATGRGGNTRFCCHFCNKSYPGSYSIVRAHLLQKQNAGVGLYSGVGMLEGADLSLDEPELEEQMIDDLS